MRDYSDYEFDALADKYGFLVVYPDGFENTWNDCRGGSPFSSKRLKIDDAGFIEALLDHEVTAHAIDRKRVFAAGWSNGEDALAVDGVRRDLMVEKGFDETGIVDFQPLGRERRAAAAIVPGVLEPVRIDDKEAVFVRQRVELVVGIIA